MKPTHFYINYLGRTKFVTLHSKNKRVTTSDGIWADSIDDLRPVTELFGREVEYHGATGVLMEALSTDNERYGKYAYTTSNGFMVYMNREENVPNNEMVRVSWKTPTSSKTLLPSWVPFNKLKLK